MKIETKAVHSGDRKKDPNAPGGFIPVTTPIYTASSYIYESTAKLDRVLGREEEGFCYSRYDNPTSTALEELVTALEGGHGALACSSGMAAMHIAVLAALMDRRKSVLAASALYGATTSLLTKVLEPLGIEISFMDVCNLDEVRQKIADFKPGCVLMETISNPLLRVGAMDRIAEMTRAAGAALLVDNTFATPLLVRPLELGAHLSVHSATKFLAGHGDVLGRRDHRRPGTRTALRSLSRTVGPVLGPFEAYLTMRGIKTFVLRVERQCSNACRIATWLSSNPRRLARSLSGRSKSSRRRRDPAFAAGGPVRRGGQLRVKRRAQGRRHGFMDRLKLVVPGDLAR